MSRVTRLTPGPSVHTTAGGDWYHRRSPGRSGLAQSWRWSPRRQRTGPPAPALPSPLRRCPYAPGYLCGTEHRTVPGPGEVCGRGDLNDCRHPAASADEFSYLFTGSRPRSVCDQRRWLMWSSRTAAAGSSPRAIRFDTKWGLFKNMAPFPIPHTASGLPG